MRKGDMNSMVLADESQDTNTQSSSGGTTKNPNDREEPVDPTSNG